MAQRLVSIHAPTRGATAKEEATSTKLVFQSTRPRGARRWMGETAQDVFTFQSTRPRGARLALVSRHASSRFVSIHAPTRGATARKCCADTFGLVSIHAPTRGATKRVRARCSRAPCFNPRAHAGRDKVVTPAPAAATRFNPRAHAGRDTPLQRLKSPPTKFQSTRPRGARHSFELVTYSQNVFQSTRPRGARRKVHRTTTSAGCVSIHAPTRGATARRARPRPVTESFNPRAHAGRDGSTSTTCAHTVAFQSTRPRGARLDGRLLRRRRCLFQSTRPRGARPAAQRGYGYKWQFQSTRPRGARRRDGGIERVLRGVSIHAPTRGATDRGRQHACTREVSIHAPTRGATQRGSACRGDCRGFNPRAHAGRDAMFDESGDHIIVSIHAPTRGATMFIQPFDSALKNHPAPRTQRRKVDEQAASEDSHIINPMKSTGCIQREPSPESSGRLWFAKWGNAKESAAHSDQAPVWRRRARPWSSSSCRGSRSAGCPEPGR